MVSVDVKHHERKDKRNGQVSSTVAELRSCAKVEVAVPNKPHGFCGRKATLTQSIFGQVTHHMVISSSGNSQQGNFSSSTSPQGNFLVTHLFR